MFMRSMRVLTVIFIGLPALIYTAPSVAQKNQAETPSMPSQAEIEDLLSKNSLDKAPIKGFNEKAVELAGQANTMIAAIRKNGRSAYALVALIAVLDDMSLNAARASAMATLVAVQAGSSDQNSHAMLDVQDLAQAEKNCYDISELLLHSTLRLIGFEEAVLHKLVDDQSPQPRKQQ